MKKFLLLLYTTILIINVSAQDKETKFIIPLKNWQVKIVGLENFYPTYLADPLGNRIEVSTQKILYSDFDFYDEINQVGKYKGKLVITPGARISLFKFGPKSNPNLGIELDFGVSIPTFMREGNHDLIGVDGIFYFAIAGRPTEWLSLRFSKHHISTHLGDEYSSGRVDSPIDYDPNVSQLPVRDDFILSAAIKPLYFLHEPQWNILQLYGDFGFFFPGSDFLGVRQNKPNAHAYFNYQAGAELEYYFKNKYLGGIFAAGNLSAYQANSFSPNISIVGGYILPQERNKRRMRVGINYYNGRSLSNQFYNRKEKFIAFIVAIDV